MVYLGVIFSFLVAIFGTNIGAGMPLPFGNQANLSAEDMEKMNSEIAKFTEELKKIDDFVANMPPEEQAEFFRQVEEVQQALNAMTPEEMNELMNEMAAMAPELFGDIPQELLYQPISQPDALPPVLPENITEAPNRILNEESESFLVMIEDLIFKLNNFLVKINTSQEFPLIIDRWLQKGKLSTVIPDTISWIDVYKNIELLVVRLSLLQEKSPINKQYIHIQAASENIVIKTTVKELLNAMNKNLNQIEVSSFGVKKISSESKKALKRILESVIPILVNNEFMNAIDAILKLYEPTAERLKSAQKAIQDYVKQLSKGINLQKIVIAGKPSDENPGYDYDQSSRYENFGYGSSGNNFGNLGTSNYDNFYNGDNGSSSGLNWDSANPIDNDNASEEKSEKSNNKKSEPKSIISNNNSENASQEQINTLINKSLGETEEKLNNIYEIFQETPILKNIKQHLFSSDDQVNFILANYSLSDLNTKISILDNNIKIIEKRILSLKDEQKRSDYINQMVEIYNKKIKKMIDNFIDEVSEIQNDWSLISSKISSEKKYAYFKIERVEKEPVDKKASPEDQESTEENEEETPPQSSKTLFELLDSCKNLNHTILFFGKTK